MQAGLFVDGRYEFVASARRIGGQENAAIPVDRPVGAIEHIRSGRPIDEYEQPDDDGAEAGDPDQRGSEGRRA